MILNPRVIRWTPPSTYVDGSAFGAADFAGYEFGSRRIGEIGYVPTVSVPVSFDITELDLSVLELPVNVDLQLAMRTVAQNGLSSVWTNPVDIRFDIRVPNPPLALIAV
jgi:hypothetical protein